MRERRGGVVYARQCAWGVIFVVVSVGVGVGVDTRVRGKE